MNADIPFQIKFKMILFLSINLSKYFENKIMISKIFSEDQFTCRVNKI
jgi:hypothetical protein